MTKAVIDPALLFDLAQSLPPTEYRLALSIFLLMCRLGVGSFTKQELETLSDRCETTLEFEQQCSNVVASRHYSSLASEATNKARAP